jgi:hypothetical protein
MPLTEPGPLLMILGEAISRLIIALLCPIFQARNQNNSHLVQNKGVESIGGGKNAFIGNHGTTWVPVDWNVSHPIRLGSFIMEHC